MQRKKGERYNDTTILTFYECQIHIRIYNLGCPSVILRRIHLSQIKIYVDIYPEYNNNSLSDQ